MKIMINSGKMGPFFTTRRRLLEQLKENGYEITLGGYQDGFASTCEDFGVKYKVIPISRAGLNPVADFKVLRAYYKIMKTEKFDIVHSYTAKPNIYGSIAARLAGVKEIYPTVNGLGYAFTGNSLKNKIVRGVISLLYAIGFACATKVFFQNVDDANEMIKRRIIKKEKCVVISGSGIELEAFPYSKLSNTNSFFLASRLLVTKGLREYFEAAKKVKAIYPEARFILAGALDPNPDGIKEEELKMYTEDGTIEYLGVVSDMQSALKECAVFVLPSFYREGVPHAILEAMSIGRAIITTDSSGCRETIKDAERSTGKGINCFLVEPKNSNELAEKMIYLLEHPEMVKQMGENSRRYAAERFDVEKVNKIMLDTMGV